MLNPAKTDLLWCTAKGSVPEVSVTPGGVNVRPSTDVRNLGVLLDSTLSKRMSVSLSWSVDATAGLDGSGVADRH